MAGPEKYLDFMKTIRWNEFICNESALALTFGELFKGCETASSYSDSPLVLRARFVFDFSARLGRTVLASDAVLLVASVAVLLVLGTASSSLSETGSCLICNSKFDKNSLQNRLCQWIWQKKQLYLAFHFGPCRSNLLLCRRFLLFSSLNRRNECWRRHLINIVTMLIVRQFNGWICFHR